METNLAIKDKTQGVIGISFGEDAYKLIDESLDNVKEEDFAVFFFVGPLVNKKKLFKGECPFEEEINFAIVTQLENLANITEKLAWILRDNIVYEIFNVKENACLFLCCNKPNGN